MPYSRPLQKEYMHFRIAFVTAVLVAAMWVWHFKVDLLVRPVITYTNGTDPMNLVTDKKSYRPGEYVYAYVSFCKNRPASGFTQWAMHNEKITWYAPTETSNLPPGCYDNLLFPIQRIPTEDVKDGEHFFVGVNTQTTPDGREATTNLFTEPFNVVID